ncbi:MAG: prohibitin family protein [Anaerolineaceae bacterium]|nr:prohibitin family protein [Anaerolineaceae bacterium]MBN2677632.1 prohibitin family protein [Anaerolineaceae bacterium]
MKRPIIWVWFVAIVGLFLIIFAFFIIPAGSVGVVTRFGAVNRVAYPGIGMKIPLVEWVVQMDVRTQKDEVATSAASRDLQVVTSTIAVNYHLDGRYAVDVYQNIGRRYTDIVIAPAIQNVFKATTAKFTAEQLITNREAVRIMAEEELAKQLLPYHVIVENFNIVNFDFSPEFNAAIEAKQVAQQQVETAKQRLAQAQVDAQTALAQAKGQADAQAILNSSGALTEAYLRYLALTKWNGILPTVTGGAIPFIDISTTTTSEIPGE